MKIIRAKNIGFCGGVRRAFKMACEKFEKKQEKRVFVLGSLAHNRGVEKKIKEMNIEKISLISKLEKDDNIIITAHGVSPKIIEKLREKNVKILDTTCPNVKSIHKLAEKYKKIGWQIFMFGDKDHKEVKGILGHCDGKAKLIADKKQADKIIEGMKKAKKSIRPFVLFSQTTKNINDFQEISKKFQKVAEEIGIKNKIVDTICRASFLRQVETKELSKNCDICIIVGGAESANTKRLWQISKKEKKPVFWIKKVTNKIPRNLSISIKKIQLEKKESNLGLISGASTPTWEIKQVSDQIEKIIKSKKV